MAKQTPKSENSRTNTGRRGGRKNPQSGQNLVLMGKGQYAALKPSPGPSFSVSAGPIVDPVQSRINKDLGYW